MTSKTAARDIQVGDYLDTDLGPALVTQIDSADMFSKNSYTFRIQVADRDPIRVGAFRPSYKLNKVI